MVSVERLQSGLNTAAGTLRWIPVVGCRACFDSVLPSLFIHLVTFHGLHSVGTAVTQ